MQVLWLDRHQVLRDKSEHSQFTVFFNVKDRSSTNIFKTLSIGEECCRVNNCGFVHQSYAILIIQPQVIFISNQISIKFKQSKIQKSRCSTYFKCICWTLDCCKSFACIYTSKYTVIRISKRNVTIDLLCFTAGDVVFIVLLDDIFVVGYTCWQFQ